MGSICHWLLPTKMLSGEGCTRVWVLLRKNWKDFLAACLFQLVLDGQPGCMGWAFATKLDEKSEELQKKILERKKSLGMTPILPAFTGHVPPSFKDKFPKVKLKKTSWVGFSSVYILDPNEPMFTEIGRKFIEEETKTYGTDHLYSADTFNENTPPTSDSVFLNDVSKKVCQSMALADPKEIWIMQGWLFYHGAKILAANTNKSIAKCCAR